MATTLTSLNLLKCWTIWNKIILSITLSSILLSTKQKMLVLVQFLGKRRRATENSRRIGGWSLWVWDTRTTRSILSKWRRKRWWVKFWRKLIKESLNFKVLLLLPSSDGKEHQRTPKAMKNISTLVNFSYLRVGRRRQMTCFCRENLSSWKICRKIKNKKKEPTKNLTTIALAPTQTTTLPLPIKKRPDKTPKKCQIKLKISARGSFPEAKRSFIHATITNDMESQSRENDLIT